MSKKEVMTMRLRMWASIVAVFIYSLITLSACSGAEELTLEEYFQLIIEINSESNEKADALTGPVGVDATSSEEANIKALQVFLQELLAVISGSNERIKSVNPPREVRNEHEELVRTSRLFRNSLRIS